MISIQEKYAHRKYNDKNTYDLTGEFGIGYALNTNEPFYFDLEDYDKIKDYRWMARHRKDRKKERYYIEHIVSRGKYKTIRIHLHQLVMGYNNLLDKNIPLIDHINRTTYDCRKRNLRIANSRINNINKLPQKSNTSGVIGVNYKKTERVWVARICDRKNHRITVYRGVSFEKAVKARLEAEKKYYKEFAPQKHLFQQCGVDLND